MRWDHTSQCQQEMTIDIHLHHRVQTVHGTQRRRCPRQCGSEKICVFRMSNYHEMLHYRTASNIASCETVDKTQRLSHEAVECWRCRWAPHSPDHSEQHTHTHTYTHTHDSRQMTSQSCGLLHSTMSYSQHHATLMTPAITTPLFDGLLSNATG